jgi:hypothetical protein
MYDIICEQTHVMLLTDRIRRSGCHNMLIEIDSDGPHVDGPHDGPRTIQYRIGPHDGPHIIQYRIVAMCMDR